MQKLPPVAQPESADDQSAGLVRFYAGPFPLSRDGRTTLHRLHCPRSRGDFLLARHGCDRYSVSQRRKCGVEIMAIALRCPSCQAKLSAPDSDVGTGKICPKCGARIIIANESSSLSRRSAEAARLPRPPTSLDSRSQAFEPSGSPETDVSNDADAIEAAFVSDLRGSAELPPTETTTKNMINCPDCRGTVSSRALSCPHCGCPIAAGRTTSRDPDRVLLIEHTRKKYKLGILLSSCLAIGGCVGFMIYTGTSKEPANAVAGVLALAFVAGLILFIVFRLKAWWHHG